VRVHKGRDMMTAPVRFPADPPLGFAGFPADPHMTRAFMPDTALLQIERKGDVPAWAWMTATVTVLSLNLLMVLLMGVVAFRLGRIRRTAAPVDAAADARADRPARSRGRIAGVHPAG